MIILNSHLPCDSPQIYCSFSMKTICSWVWPQEGFPLFLSLAPSSPPRSMRPAPLDTSPCVAPNIYTLCEHSSGSLTKLVLPPPQLPFLALPKPAWILINQKLCVVLHLPPTRWSVTSTPITASESLPCSPPMPDTKFPCPRPLPSLTCLPSCCLSDLLNQNRGTPVSKGSRGSSVLPGFINSVAPHTDAQ